MNYEIKTGEEGIWFSVQTAIAAVSGWALVEWTDMETVAVVLVAGALGSISRPVLGYLASFLPKRS